HARQGAVNRPGGARFARHVRGAPQSADRRKHREGSMIRRLKMTAFAATFASFAIMAGAYDLGFERWPPATALADGQSVRLDPAGVQACFKARLLSFLADIPSAKTWQGCRQRLIAYGALDAFNLRSMVVGAG